MHCFEKVKNSGIANLSMTSNEFKSKFGDDRCESIQVLGQKINIATTNEPFDSFVISDEIDDFQDKEF